MINVEVRVGGSIELVVGGECAITPILCLLSEQRTSLCVLNVEDSRGKNDEQVQEHCPGRQPTKSLQRADLSNNATSDHAHNHTDDETKVAFRQLADTLATAENNEGNVEKELERLQDVARVTKPTAVDTEADVAVSFHGVTITVHLAVDFPELVATVACKGSEDREERDAGPKTHLGKGVAGTERAKNVGCDQVEASTPKMAVRTQVAKEMSEGCQYQLAVLAAREA